MSKKSKAPSKTYGPCIVENCENEAQLKSAQVCLPCYSGMYYWTRPKNHKTPTDILKHTRRLMVRIGRMKAIQPIVVHMPLKRKDKVNSR